MSKPTVHVVGAGLAGLAAASRLCDSAHVELYDAAGHAGGRCRSYFDAALGIEIDNGNHLVLSGNAATMAFLDAIDSASELVGPQRSDFAFADLATGERWTLAINDGPIPWWIFVPSRRVPGTKPADYLSAARLLKAGSAATVADMIGSGGALYERLWRPFFLAALNTDPAEASAELAKTVVVETLLKGGRACRPRVAANGLSRAFIDPAIAFLKRRNAGIRFNCRARSLQYDNDSVAAVDFGDEVVKLAPGDALVLAVPGQIAADLVPGYIGPTSFGAIVNAHFKIAPPPGLPAILGVVGGTVEWLFAFPDRLSVTISGANRLLDTSREALAADIWREVAMLTGLPTELPPWQIVKERRATFAATPAENARRPQAATRWSNLVLAGDWVANGLPSTIEGAIRSGHAAAAILMGCHGSAGLLPKSRAESGMARSHGQNVRILSESRPATG